VVGLFTANVPTVAEFSYDIGTMTATWRFEGWANADQYAIVVKDSVTDLEGNRLDGEWVNYADVYGSIDAFPSGNGAAGGNFSFIMTILPGDAHPDGVVDETDYDYYFLTYLGMTQGATFDQADFDGDGDVDWDDYGYWSANYGTDFTSVWIMADLDGDYDVDQSDLDALMDNFGMTNATWADGDLNQNGVVDEDDLDLAFAQFGLKLSVVS
jgi:hypothetical protein